MTLHDVQILPIFYKQRDNFFYRHVPVLPEVDPCKEMCSCCMV